MKPRLISGIQPTGKLHIGNYLGALQNFVELQNSGKYDCFFFIADLHSLTESYNPKEKGKQIEDLLLDYLSAGLDPKKSTIFLQSAIPAHTEFAWILNTLTPMGELERMTQFKDKASIEKHVFRNEINVNDDQTDEKNYEMYAFKGLNNPKFGINTGLLTYPILMASDILLYDAKFVPVGDDQLQHLELTRTLARKFNNVFGKTLVEPKPLLTKVPRLMGLDDPMKKMSKSRPSGCLFLDDSKEEIKKKIMRAVTDSGNEIICDPVNKPAVSNLLLLFASLSKKEIYEAEKMFEGKGYAEFKSTLLDTAIGFLSPLQKRKKEMKKEINSLKKILEKGNKKALQISSEKMNMVKKKIGINFIS